METKVKEAIKNMIIRANPVFKYTTEDSIKEPTFTVKTKLDVVPLKTNEPLDHKVVEEVHLSATRASKEINHLITRELSRFDFSENAGYTEVIAYPPVAEELGLKGVEATMCVDMPEEFVMYVSKEYLNINLDITDTYEIIATVHTDRPENS